MLLTPITCPAMLTRGPPELPGLIAASVWMKSNPGAATVSGAPLRLTMPNETDCSRPNGWPSASTNSPTRMRLESPRGSTGSPPASMRTRARSTRRSSPTVRPLKRRPSARRTWIHSACSMTWALVTIRPLDSMMKPEPVDRRGSPGPSSSFGAEPARRTRTCTSAGLSRSARSASRSLKRVSSGAAADAGASCQSFAWSALVGRAQPSGNMTSATRASTARTRTAINANLLVSRLSSIARLAARLAQQVPELWNQELVERQPAGVGRAGERNDDTPRVDAHLRAAEHGGRPDFLEGEHAEQLPETGQALVEQRLHRLVRGVARGDAGAAGVNHRLDVVACARVPHEAGHLRRLVAHDGRARHPVAGRGEELANDGAARVGLRILGVGDGQHEAADALRRRGLVLPRRGVATGHGPDGARTASFNRRTLRGFMSITLVEDLDDVQHAHRRAGGAQPL